jgi:hypothetical protein
MFHLIGVVTVVVLGLALIGWAFPAPVQPPPPAEPDLMPTLNAIAARLGGELKKVDAGYREAERVLSGQPVDHRATIEEYRTRFR